MAFLFCVILTFSLPLAISANVLNGQECDNSKGEVWLGGTTESDFAACKQACEDDPQCQSVTFYNHGSCSLFSTKCEATRPSNNARSELVKELGGMSGVECDSTQGEVYLTQSQEADFAACKKACKDNTRCQSVTFYHHGGCSLFSTKCEKTKASAGANSAVVKELSGGIGQECDTSQGEIYLSGSHEADLAECKKACEDDAHCHSITFYNGGYCSLFGTTCDKMKANPAAQSALVKEIEEPAKEQCEIDGTCHVAHGEECDRTQGEIYLADGSAELSYEACKQACKDRLKCQSITYFSHGWCSLFQTQCQHRKPFKDALSRTLKADFFNGQECDGGNGEIYLSASSGNQANLAACQKSCEDTPQCKSTTFFKSGWCSHYSTCCNNRKPSATGTADAVKTAQCVDACVIENGGCDSKRACTSTDGVATCADCLAPFINDGATDCKEPAPADPCKTNNGGCDSKRACTNTGGVATCGGCPAGFIDDGAKGCKAKPKPKPPAPKPTEPYVKTNKGQYCPSKKADIVTETECRAAAKALGLKYGSAFNGPEDHKDCLLAEDGRDLVFFNLAGAKKASASPKPTYSSLCKVYDSTAATTTRPDPCKTKNGGCHSKRKCTSPGGQVTCGHCAAGFYNDGPKGCKQDPCKTKNGGCHIKRKCTSPGGRVSCGPCASGFTNIGGRDCAAIIPKPKSGPGGYIGCYQNEGNNRVVANVGDLTIPQCRALAHKQGKAFFGMEYPQCCAEANIGQCKVLSSRPSLTVKPDSECEKEKDKDGLRLGGMYRLAVYDSTATTTTQPAKPKPTPPKTTPAKASQTKCKPEYHLVEEANSCFAHYTGRIDLKGKDKQLQLHQCAARAFADSRCSDTFAWGKRNKNKFYENGQYKSFYSCFCGGKHTLNADCREIEIKTTVTTYDRNTPITISAYRFTKCSAGATTTQVFAPKSNTELQAPYEASLKASDFACTKGPHGPIGSWDVSAVTDLRYFFAHVLYDGEAWDLNRKFRGDISKWDVSKVTTMSNMFYQASSFKSDITMWDVRNVKYMNSMFYGASSFYYTLCGKWKEVVDSGIEHRGMFRGSRGTICTYTATYHVHGHL